ncbi:MAG: NAD(P)-dependent oxidoreductase [Candidatus ainarchaeum sp.]|nr:NAD(P)-dependent oxidoreductase [Candidatus ainarchaeum sp.]
MKIFVTGSEGLVGKELINELENKGHEVIKFDFKKGQNILDKKKLGAYLKKIDVVIHLAGIINENNKKMWEINVEGTKNILEESINKKIKKFIFLSSTGVYGFTKGIVDENSELKPITKYEKSKYEGEQVVLNRQEEIHVNIIRSAMIFGKNDYWKKMITLLEKNFPLPCNGKNIFQIICVKELVNAIIQIIKTGEPSEIYLISGKEKLTLKEFCKKIKKELGKKEFVWSIPETIAILFGNIFKIKILNKNNILHLKKQRNYCLEKIYKIGFKHKYKLDNQIKKIVKEIKND